MYMCQIPFWIILGKICLGALKIDVFTDHSIFGAKKLLPILGISFYLNKWSCWSCEVFFSLEILDEDNVQIHSSICWRSPNHL